uniref:Uncharacterized protein n=1 Tax=Tetranychus urticae TaxID=32264 RepID=T1KX83_TETUR
MAVNVLVLDKKDSPKLMVWSGKGQISGWK